MHERTETGAFLKLKGVRAAPCEHWGNRPRDEFGDSKMVYIYIYIYVCVFHDEPIVINRREIFYYDNNVKIPACIREMKRKRKMKIKETYYNAILKTLQ